MATKATYGNCRTDRGTNSYEHMPVLESVDQYTAMRVQLMNEQDSEAAIRSRSESFIGMVLAQRMVEKPDLADAEDALALRPIESLYDAIIVASETEQGAGMQRQARQMIELNVATDLYERAFKSGNVTQVELDIDIVRGLQQHGQSLESVQANSLAMTYGNQKMFERVKAETRNMFRLNQALESGLLDNNYMVVFSRAADDMSLEEMERAGFFTDTMSCSIQIASVQNKILVLESAFVTGVHATPDGDNVRHDAQAIDELISEIGLPKNRSQHSIPQALPTATELLDMPLLVPKNRIPHGVIDLVRFYDKAVGWTFFGEGAGQVTGRTPQEYINRREFCLERATKLQDMTQAITDMLIAEADTVRTRTDAARRLSQLSAQYLLAEACKRTDIDPNVFGAEAAAYIEQARIYFVNQQQEAFMEAMAMGQKTQRSSSCPGGAGELLFGANQAGADQEKPMENADESGDCEFVSKECPLCQKKNVKTTVKKKGNGKEISGDCGCSIVTK